MLNATKKQIRRSLDKAEAENKPPHKSRYQDLENKDMSSEKWMEESLYDFNLNLSGIRK